MFCPREKWFSPHFFFAYGNACHTGEKPNLSNAVTQGADLSFLIIEVFVFSIVEEIIYEFWFNFAGTELSVDGTEVSMLRRCLQVDV